MTSPPITIANAIAYEINAQSWSLTPATVEMSHADWKLKIEESDGLRVDVVPVATPEFDQETQGSWNHTIETDVLIRNRFTQDDDEIDLTTGRTKTAKINALVDLLYEMVEFFAPKQNTQDGRALSQETDAAWRGVKILTIRDKQMLTDFRQYVGAFRLTYELVT